LSVVAFHSVCVVMSLPTGVINDVLATGDCVSVLSEEEGKQCFSNAFGMFFFNA
jgi:hypothetical protein